MKNRATDERPFSRLPRDPEYWERLGDRIGAAAAPQLNRRRGEGSWFARRAAVLAALAAAAVITAWTLLPPPGSDVALGSGDVLRDALVPIDPLFEALSRADMPPNIGTLVTTDGGTS